MKKISLYVLALLCCVGLKAQVIITPQLQQVGITLKSQLWNAAISNTGTTTLQVKLNVLLTDVSNGQQVLSATTTIFSLPQGVKILQYSDVTPVVYTVLNANYNIDASPNGFLPVGNFDVCYSILQQTPETFETIAEECVPIEVEPLSPPLLNLPSDEAEIEEVHPLLNWLPPTPISFFSNLSYDVKLVEVLNTQNSVDAIAQNTPIFYQSNYSTTSLLYPSSLPPLDTGKLYAWQVAAKNNGVFVANSEVWTFRVKLFSQDNYVYQRETPYFKLKQEAATDYFVAQGLLKFVYTNDINDTQAHLTIYDITNGQRIKINLPSPIIRVHYGQNFIDYPVSELSGIIDGHYYQVEVVSSKGAIWQGRFEYKQNN